MSLKTILLKKIRMIKSWLPEETIKDPTAAERLFCAPFEKVSFPCSDLFINACQQVRDPNWTQTELTKFQIWQLKELRDRHASGLSVKLDEKTFVFLTLVSEEIMHGWMYLVYIQYWAKHAGVHPTITVPCDLVQTALGGLPSKKDLSHALAAQKVNVEKGSTNLLEYVKALDSLQL